MVSIAVAGMWHLGSVTAACLASAGHRVVGIDEDSSVIEKLGHGIPPVAEPGLAEMIAAELAAGRLRFSTRFEDAAVADIVWVAWDTPVDENDKADVEFVHHRALRLLEQMKDGALLVVSSQMPVGSIARLEREFEAMAPGRAIDCAAVPENLRLGKAIDVFLNPDRVVAGARNARSRQLLQQVYSPFTDRIEWMSVESAEMTKHAINSFLATSICFINEIAAVCERTGADAAEVERGLKTEQRIGPRAYLHAGAAYAGGTLARDIRFLRSLGGGGAALPLIDGVHASNERHKNWLKRRMKEVMGSFAGVRVGVLGLTYKPGTDTLRRSAAIETACWLHKEGANVRAFDPQVPKLPDEATREMSLCASASELLRDSDVIAVMTPWPEFQEIDAALAPPVIFDPGRFLENLFGARIGTRYYTIGRTN